MANDYAQAEIEALRDPRFTLGAFRPAVLRTVVRERLRLLGLLRHAGLGAAVTLVLCDLVSVAVAPAAALTTGDLVGAVAAGRSIAVPLGTVVAVMLVGQVAVTARTLSAAVAARRVDGAIRARVRRIALAPDGIGHLDDASFRDDVERACDLGITWRVRSPGNAAAGQLMVVARVLSAAAAAVVLAGRFPVLAAGVFVASLLMRMLMRRQWMWLTEVQDARVGEERRARYYARMLSEAGPAKDVRVFGLGEWFGRRMHDAALHAHGLSWRARDMVVRRQGPAVLLAGGSAAAILIEVGRSGMPAAAAAKYLTAAFAVAWVSVMEPEAFDVDYGVTTLRALDRVAARHLPAPSARRRAAVGDGPPRVRFENVTFTYPGAVRPTLEALDLEIRPGESLAVVGVNGAGKTTMMKLLAGLYRPDSGRIMVDGADLADLDPAAWRARISMLFQDFVHYDATLADNVALSAPEALDDAAGIAAALDAAGAADVVARLPDGTATLLMRGGGTELSGGQWQKVAIARTLFAARHGRTLLVLDEPTAHLDVEAEQKFNRRVIAGAPHTSPIVISHRLSNVRGADRIVVLDGGRITETGSHAGLLEADGTYARLWRLQAARFADPEEDR